MDRLVREGATPAEVIRKIKVAYSEAASPTFIMNAIGKHGVHPNLVNGPVNQQAAAARCAPFLNAPCLTGTMAEGVDVIKRSCPRTIVLFSLPCFVQLRSLGYLMQPSLCSFC